MKRQAGARLALRLLLIFAFAIPAALTAVAEYLFREQIANARAEALVEARELSGKIFAVAEERLGRAEIGFDDVAEEDFLRILRDRDAFHERRRVVVPGRDASGSWAGTPNVYLVLGRDGRLALETNGMPRLSSLGTLSLDLPQGIMVQSPYTAVDAPLEPIVGVGLERSSRLVGVTLPYGDGSIVIARVVMRDWSAVLGLIVIGAALLAAVATLALVITWRFNRAMRLRAEAMVRTLDDAESSGYRLRVSAVQEGDEFARLGSAINAMMERTGETTGQLRRVSLHIAHDLRAPLRTSLQLVRRLASAAHDRESGDDLGRVAGQLEEVQRRCEQLLAIAEVESATPEQHKPVDIERETLLVADDFAGLAEDKGCALAAATAPATIMGARAQIQRMLLNILQNAVKFAEPGTPILVDLETGDGKARLSVTNHSADIPSDLIERIFEPEVSLQGGTGLGLPLVRSVARRHGGEAQAASFNGLFRIEVTLPTLEEEAP